VQKLAGRLSQVFRLYPQGVSDKLIQLMKLKLLQAERRSSESDKAAE
jgi:hypothetical protein